MAQLQNRCDTCQHWHPCRPGGRALDFAIGECRHGSPRQSFTWPKTKAIDGCAQHSNAAQFATARTAEQPNRRAPRTGMFSQPNPP